MPVSEKLLEILCCPKTKVPVGMLPEEQLTRLNELIGKRQVKYVDGSTVEGPVEEGLITEDKKTIYTVNDGIPVMLIDKGIAADQLAGG